MSKTIGLAAGLLLFLFMVYLKNPVHYSLSVGIATFIMVSGLLETFSHKN